MYGYNAARSAVIDSMELEEMKVYLYGYNAGYDLDILCRSGASCSLYCRGNGCDRTELYYSGSIDSVTVVPADCVDNQGGVADDGSSCPKLIQSSALIEQEIMEQRQQEIESSQGYLELLTLNGDNQ